MQGSRDFFQTLHGKAVVSHISRKTSEIWAPGYLLEAENRTLVSRFAAPLRFEFSDPEEGD
jgi:hypothetical protein